MARLTDMQRLSRVLELLAGLGHPEVRAALSGRGFSQREADEGFQLLRVAVEAFHSGATPPVAAPATLALLDAWENRWLPIIEAALERHFPQLAKSVLLNIRQTRGFELFVTLPLLLERIEALGQSSLEPQRRAYNLLVRRGFTAEVMAEARQLLHEVRRVSAAPPAQPNRREATLDALWSWYLDWSRTARTVIQDRRLLRSLGFGKP